MGMKWAWNESGRRRRAAVAALLRNCLNDDASDSRCMGRLCFVAFVGKKGQRTML